MIDLEPRLRRALRLAASVLLAGSALLAANRSASADDSPSAVKIGILDDLSEPYSLTSGLGTVEAVKLAIEDYGGKALGKPI
jgi:branched-chain amino acid transport system substrate-binding protein